MKQSTRGLLTIVLGALLIIVVGECINSAGSKALAQRRRAQTPRRAAPQKARKQQPRIDYSRFSHRTHVEQQKLACGSCHKFPSKNWKDVRKGDEAFPDVTDFPEHQSCLECHRSQFFARERPAPLICSNCHIAVTPRNTARYPFPSLGESFLASNRGQNFTSDFKVLFPHDKHIDVVGAVRERPGQALRVALLRVSFDHDGTATTQDKSKSCSICHETYQPQGKSSEEFVTKPPTNLTDETFWLKKGAFKTTPTTHAACASCHNEEAGIPPAPGDCAVCHKFPTVNTEPLRDFEPKLAAAMGIKDWLLLRKWSRRSAGRYRHEFDVHNELGCVNCHNPAAMNTLEEKTLVTVKSCAGEGGCHIETNTDGILNYEIEQKRKNPSFQCSKCHIVLGKNPLPQNHLDAIPRPVAK